MKRVAISEMERINIRSILLNIERLAERPALLAELSEVQTMLSALIGLKELGTKLDDGMIELEYLIELENPKKTKRRKK